MSSRQNLLLLSHLLRLLQVQAQNLLQLLLAKHSLLLLQLQAAQNQLLLLLLAAQNQLLLLPQLPLKAPQLQQPPPHLQLQQQPNSSRSAHEKGRSSGRRMHACQPLPSGHWLSLLRLLQSVRTTTLTSRYEGMLWQILLWQAMLLQALGSLYCG